MYSCSSRDSVTIREGRDSWMRMLSMVDGCWRPNGKSHSSGQRQLVPAAHLSHFAGPAPFSAGRRTSGNSVELAEGTPRPIGKPHG
jgi:hypothetical protein